MSEQIETTPVPTDPTPTNTNTHSFAITILGNMSFDIITATYAVIVAAGGIMGYAKAQSIPSLVAGLTFGGLIGAGSYLEASRK